MEKGKEKLFAVFGLGKFGYEVCRVLADSGAKVIAVDREQKRVNKVRDMVTEAILIETNDEETFLNANLQDVDVGIVALGSNIQGSILTTTLLKNIGVPYIIARAMSDVHAQVLKQTGATEVLNLEIEEGKRLARRILAPDLMDIIPVSADQSVVEMRVPREFVGRSLIDLKLRQKYQVNIVSIKRIKTTIDDIGNPEREETVITPGAEDVLEVNDILVMLGAEKDIDKIKELSR